MENLDIGSIGARIRDLRKSKGLTQAKLAEECYTHQSIISDIENGEKVPDLSLIVKLQELFCVEFEVLIYGKQPEPRIEVSANANESDKPVTVAINGGSAHVDVHHHVAESQESYEFDPIGMAFLNDWRSLDEIEQMRFWTLLKEAKSKQKRAEV